MVTTPEPVEPEITTSIEARLQTAEQEIQRLRDWRHTSGNQTQVLLSELQYTVRQLKRRVYRDRETLEKVERDLALVKQTTETDRVDRRDTVTWRTLSRIAIIVSGAIGLLLWLLKTFERKP